MVTDLPECCRVSRERRKEIKRLRAEDAVNKAVTEIAREIVMHWHYEKPNCKVSAVIDADYITRLENAFDGLDSVSGIQGSSDE